MSCTTGSYAIGSGVFLSRPVSGIWNGGYTSGTLYSSFTSTYIGAPYEMTDEERIEEYYELKGRFDILDAELREEGLLENEKEHTEDFKLSGSL